MSSSSSSSSSSSRSRVPPSSPLRSWSSASSLTRSDSDSSTKTVDIASLPTWADSIPSSNSAPEDAAAADSQQSSQQESQSQSSAASSSSSSSFRPNPDLLSFVSRFTSSLSPPVSASLNSKIVLYHGDITSLEVDAVVNAANSHLERGGGICGAIFRAAGSDQLQRECRSIGSVKTGQTAVTKGYLLPAKAILHTVGPIDSGNARTSPQLVSCYRTILDRCLERSLRSVAVCCVSTGIYGFPNEPACALALSAVREWLEESDQHANAVDKIVFCTFMDKDKDLYGNYTALWFPRDENDKRLWDETLEEMRKNENESKQRQDDGKENGNNDAKEKVQSPERDGAPSSPSETTEDQKSSNAKGNPRGTSEERDGKKQKNK